MQPEDLNWLHKKDRLSLKQKWMAARRMAQPFKFSLAAADDDQQQKGMKKYQSSSLKKMGIAQASIEIAKTAEKISVLLGLEEEEEGAAKRSSAALREWNDIFRHPSFYTQVFRDWVGVIEKRNNKWEMYNHESPERHGHAVRLMDWKFSPIATAWKSNLKPEDQARFPGHVVRLKNTSWFFGGFLTSLVLWLDLEFNQAKKIENLSDKKNHRANVVNISDLLRKPALVLGQELYTNAWLVLYRIIKRILYQPRSGVNVWKIRGMEKPLMHPDVVWMSTLFMEALEARSKRRNRFTEQDHDIMIRYDSLELIGLSGIEMRRQLYTIDMKKSQFNAGLSQEIDWLIQAKIRNLKRRYADSEQQWLGVAQQEELGMKKLLLQVEYLQKLQHQHNLKTSWINVKERYVPFSPPPHPMAALLFANRDSSGKPFKLISLDFIRIKHFMFAAEPTGLLIEQWGQAWGPKQRAFEEADRARGSLIESMQRITKELLEGNNVTGYDDVLIQARKLELLGISMPPVREAETQPIFQPGRMTTVESIEITGLGRDEQERWEENGIRLPAVWHRNTFRLDHKEFKEGQAAGRPIVKLILDPLPRPRITESSIHEMLKNHESRWGLVLEDALRSQSPILIGLFFYFVFLKHRAKQMEKNWKQRGVWPLKDIQPFPVNLEVVGADLTCYGGGGSLQSLEKTPVIRILNFRTCRIPNHRWIAQLLEMPKSLQIMSSRRQIAAYRTPEVWNKIWKTNTSGGQHRLVLNPWSRLSLVGFFLQELLPPKATQEFDDSPQALMPSYDSMAILRAPKVGSFAFRDYPNLSYLGLVDLNLKQLPGGIFQLISPSRNHPNKHGKSDNFLVLDVSQNPMQKDTFLSKIAILSLITLAVLDDIDRKGQGKPHLWINFFGAKHLIKAFGSSSMGRSSFPFSLNISEHVVHEFKKLVHQQPEVWKIILQQAPFMAIVSNQLNQDLDIVKQRLEQMLVSYPTPSLYANVSLFMKKHYHVVAPANSKQQWWTLPVV